MDKTFRQKINEETEDLNNTINKLDLMDIYKTLQPTTIKYTFLKGARHILQDRPYVRPQNNFQYILKD